MREQHSEVVDSIRSKQSPVEDLLEQADNLIANQKPKAEVKGWTMMDFISTPLKAKLASFLPQFLSKGVCVDGSVAGAGLEGPE